MKLTKAKKIFSNMKEKFGEYKSNLIDVRNWICPNRTCFADDDNEYTENRYNYKRIITNTAYKAAKIFAKGVCNGLMPRGKKWVGIERQKDYGQEINEWCDDVENIMFSVLDRSKLYTFLPLIILDNKIFGFSALGVFEDATNGVKFVSLDIGSFYYDLDSYGSVLSFAREFKMSVKEIFDEFNPENDLLQNELNSCPDKKYTIKQLIVKNNEKNKSKIQKKWLSLYFIDGKDYYLRESGYDVFPYIIPIIDRANNNNIYGSSSGLESLGNVKMLQKLKKMEALGIEKIVRPPVVISSDEDIESVNLLPDGITRVSSLNNNSGVVPIFKNGIDLNSLEYAIQNTQNEIMNDFDANLFVGSSLSSKRMTAEEVSTINAERVIQFNSIFNTYTSELCEPLLKSVFSILYSLGKLPAVPDGLDIRTIKIQYFGDIAKYEYLNKTQNLERFVNFIMSLAQQLQSREIINMLNTSEIFDLYLEYLDVSNSVKRDAFEIEELNQKQAQEMALQQQQIQATQAVQEMQKLSQSKIEDNNVLGRLIQQTKM